MEKLREQIKRDLGLTGNATEDCKKILQELSFDPDLMRIEKYDTVPVEYDIKDDYISISWKCRHECAETSIYSPEKHKSLLSELLVCAEWLYETEGF
jgi:hypothetical protein